MKKTFFDDMFGAQLQAEMERQIKEFEKRNPVEARKGRKHWIVVNKDRMGMIYVYRTKEEMDEIVKGISDIEAVYESE